MISARKERILEAAIEVFSEHGFERATNALIARKAGISPGLIYWYFDSKEALFVEAARSKALSAMGSFQSVLVGEPAKALYEVARTYLQYFQVEEHAQLSRMFLNEIGRFSRVDQVFGEALRGFIEGVAGYLREGMAAGRLREVDPLVAAQTFVGSLFSFVMRYRIMRIEPVPMDVERVAHTVVSLFLRGIERS
jgi:AcrR family transcriptional regulator